MYKIHIALCLLLSWSAAIQAQGRFQIIGEDGNATTDLDQIINESVLKIEKQRKKYSKVTTIAEGIALMKAELKQQNLERFGSLLTEEQVLASTKRSLAFQHHNVHETLKLMGVPPSSDVAAKHYKQFSNGPVAAFAPIKERKFPIGAYFDHGFGRDGDGLITSFIVYLSAKPDKLVPHPALKTIPIFEHRVTIYEVRFGWQ